MRRIINAGIVVLLLLIGLAVLFSVLLKVREPAARTQCTWNMAQIGRGLAEFHKEHDAFPYGTVPNPDLPPEQRLSWYVSILPYALRESPFAKFDREKAWDAADNQEAVHTPIRLFLCPTVLERGSLPATYVTTYIGMAGRGADAATLPPDDPRAGCFGYNRHVTFDTVRDHDGVSQTMQLVESAWQNGPWAAGGPPTVRGVDPALQPYIGAGRPFGGIHLADRPKDAPPETIVLILFVDGAVRPFLESMNPRIFEAFATYAGDDEVLE